MFLGMVYEWSILKFVSCKKATVTNNKILSTLNECIYYNEEEEKQKKKTIKCCTLLHIAALLSDKTSSNFKF